MCSSDLELLKELCESAGIPGREGRLREIVRRELAPLSDEVRVDALGNLIAVKKASKGRKPRRLPKPTPTPQQHQTPIPNQTTPTPTTNPRTSPVDVTLRCTCPDRSLLSGRRSAPDFVYDRVHRLPSGRVPDV